MDPPNLKQQALGEIIVGVKDVSKGCVVTGKILRVLQTKQAKVIKVGATVKFAVHCRKIGRAHV